MEATYELLMKAILENDKKFKTFLTRGININKICSNGMTLIGAAAQKGNLSVLKILIDCHGCDGCSALTLDHREENKNKPQYLQLDSDGQKRYTNIGYFVVCRDVEENEFGDGPTPDGMEGLEWDMEVNSTHFSTEDEGAEDGEVNMYRWYANILNRTSVMLESPERDIGRLDRHGQSVLHYAVNSGNIDMVEFLMATFGKELSINQNDYFCCSPLHIAAANRDIEMVKWLLSRGANVNAIGGQQRQSPLHIAAGAGHLPIIRVLIEAGADVNAVDVDERSILTLIIRQQSEEAIRYIVDAGARVNHEESGGVTPLRLAVWANNTAVVRILIDGGARVVHSYYLLHTAVTCNNLEIVKMLIKAGARLNSRNDQGHTPLMIACTRKNLPIARYLIAHGANVNMPSHIDGKTALHICAQDVRETKCVHQLVELLVRHGANMNAPSYQGCVLFYSILFENKSAATALIQHGADVNLRDDRAYVDHLSLAKRHGDLDLVRLIVYAGFQMPGMAWDPRALRRQSVDPACDFLIYVKSNPLNLREICRIIIRRHIRHIGPRELVSRIYSLPLPTIVHKYLALEIL